MAIHLSYQTTEIIAVSRAYKVVVSVQHTLCVLYRAGTEGKPMLQRPSS